MEIGLSVRIGRVITVVSLEVDYYRWLARARLETEQQRKKQSK